MVSFDLVCSLLSPLHLLCPLARSLRFPLLPRQNSWAFLNPRSERRNDPLDDVSHATALWCSGRELNHVSLAQRVARVGDQVGRHLGVCLADVGVVDGVAVGDADGAVHLADGEDGSGLDGVRVAADGGLGLFWLGGGGGGWLLF